MSNVNRDAIRAFLRSSSAPDDLADRAMVAAETLFALADEDRYALYDASRSTPAHRAAFESLPVMEPIHRATNRPTEHVLHVSDQHPIARQPWMAVRAYEQRLQFHLDEAAQEILEDSVEPTFEDAIEIAQRDHLERALDAVASAREFPIRWGTLDIARDRAAGLPTPPGFSWRSICFEKLGDSLVPVHEAVERQIGYDNAYRVCAVLKYLFAFAITGDEERVALFMELTEILAWVIPIGWKKDEPSVLLIHVA